MRLSVPPQSGKYACDQASKQGKVNLTPHMSKWARAALAALKVPAWRFDIHDTSVRSLDLAHAMKSDLTLVKLALAACDRHPTLRGAFDRFYGRELFHDSLLALRKQALVDGSILCGDEPRPGPRYTWSGSILEEKRAVGPPVEIHMRDDVLITKNRPAMTEAEQEKLLRDGYLIKDPRTGEELSVVYNTQTRLDMSNPAETCLHDILVKPGKFEQMLVIVNPHSGGGRKNFTTVVRPDGDKGWLNIQRTELWSRMRDSQEKFIEWCSKKGKADLQEDGVYVPVSKNG